jgi:hypothetical protein
MDPVRTEASMAQAERVRRAGGPVANTGTGVLLFYRFDTGLATTGRIDASGAYADLRNHNLDPGWHQVFPLRDGLVLFNRSPKSGLGDLVAGRVLSDGSYQDLRTNVAFGYTRNLVEIGDNVVLAYMNQHDVRIGRIEADGSYVVLRNHGGFDPVTAVVSTHDGLVLLYERTYGRIATIRVNSDGSYQDLRSQTGFDYWTHIIATTNRILLFYNEYSGAAVTGRMDANGSYADLRTYRFDPYWRYIVPTMDGHVLFVSNLKGSKPILGTIDAEGGYADGPSLGGGFDAWSFIGSVL